MNDVGVLCEVVYGYKFGVVGYLFIVKYCIVEVFLDVSDDLRFFEGWYGLVKMFLLSGIFIFW